MFFAPALLWLGATLLLVRLRGRALTLDHRARRAAARASTRRDFLLLSASRRGAAINRGLVVVGLLLAFGVNLGIFSATYNQQVKADAQLTLGADVTVTAPPGVDAQAAVSPDRSRGARRARRDRRRALIRLRRTRPAGHIRHRRPIVLERDTLRDSYFLHSTAPAGARTPAPHAGRDRRQQRDDHRLLAQARRPAAPARARPAQRQISRRSVPRRRHRAGVPLGAEGLLHGRQPELPGVGHPRGRSERRLREGRAATRRRSHAGSPQATAVAGHEGRATSTARAPARAARSRPST